MSLSQAQLAARAGKLTASRIGALMSGDPDKVLTLWEIMTGIRNEEDLSHVWPVQLGIVTERLNLDWYARVTGRPLSRRGEVVTHGNADWAACTLDAFDAVLPGPVEAKHCGGFEPREKIIARYTPQLAWQCLCTGCDKAALSIIEGAREPVVEQFTLDTEYGSELFRRAQAFMECVWNLTPPVALPALAAPIAPAQWRTVDMADSNSWAANAHTWLSNRESAKAFDGAAKELKALMAADVGFASGHGISCIRDRAGRLSIKEAP